MVPAQTQASISIEQVGPEAVLPFVEIAAGFDTTGGKESALFVARDGGYLIKENGTTCAGFTMRRNGTECFVTAAGATGSKTDITRTITAALFNIKGVRSIAFQTRRRGLMRKARALGFRQIGTVQNGVIMQKVINVSHS